MCGISGILGANLTENDLTQLLDPIAHRGEEKYRYETIITPEIALGTHRLAIVDEKCGKQPFQSLDKRVLAIFNGQIYNHSKLRKALSPEFKFNSLCDTEVVLNSYLKWGKDFVNHLDGQFAIAVYDTEKKELILARDPMGIKPLYYVQSKEKLSFSSEIKSFVNTESNEILELLPGSLLINSCNEKYFSLGDFNTEENISNAISDYIPLLRENLKQAVEKRIKKEDSKIACLLSGGVDSSIITYLATQAHPNVVAYTLSEPGKNSGDLSASCKLIDFLKIQHVVVSPSIEEMGDFYLQHGVYMTESFEPILVRNAVAYHFICRRVAKDGFKYCLNGEGADELFGGYDFVREAPKEKQDNLIKHSLSIIHNSYLKMADRASMYATLEARVPYMDRAFIEVALNLPPQARILGDMNKVALRTLFQNELPDEIIYRKKVGMNEGAGFGINRPEQSIYYAAVKFYYEKNIDQYEQDLSLVLKENGNSNVDTKNIEEIYNFARFIEHGFNRLKGGTKRLQLNASLRSDLVI